MGWRKLKWQVAEGSCKLSCQLLEQVIEERVSDEKREKAIKAAIRVSVGGKELVLLPALSVGSGRLENLSEWVVGIEKALVVGN